MISSSDLESRDNLKPFTVGVLGSGNATYDDMMLLLLVYTVYVIPLLTIPLVFVIMIIIYCLLGQVLGELAVLSPGSPSPTTAVTFTNVEVFKFESDLLLSLGAKFNSATVNVLNESLNLYNPPDEKIGHYYRSKYSWETRKRKILKSLVKDRPSLSGRFHELDH